MIESNLTGALKQVTPAVLLRAVGLVRKGKVYRLAHTLEPAMPQLVDNPDIARGRRLTIEMRTTDLPQFGTQIFSDWVSFETHSGTHIDCFSHWSWNGRMHGGLDPTEVYSDDGMKKLGLDEAAPLVTRGVLIDVAGCKGAEWLPGGTVLQPEELQEALQRQGVGLQSGDVVLVRTGWAKHWRSASVYMSEAPGLSRRSAEWIADQQCVAIGIDQSLVDPLPPERIEDRRACHEVCLVERGMYLMESLNLEDLVRDRVFEFLFVAAPAPLKGGTGFPIQALAIV